MTDTTKKTPATVIIIRESLTDSVLSDLMTFTLMLIVFGLGIWADSTAMQWFGAVAVIFGLIVKASRKTTRLTIAEARAKLDDLERGGA